MVSKKSSGSVLVYSTETGRICPECAQAIGLCRCNQVDALAPTDGIVRVALETKGRRGKGVTVINGVPLNTADLLALGKQLKAACGSGGTTKNGIIEIQGDHREVVIARLKERGWQIKRVGG